MRAGVAMAPASLQAPRCPGRSRCGLCEPATAEHGLSQKNPRSVAGTLVPRTAASAQPRPRLGRRHVPARRSQESTAAARTPAAWGRPGRGPGPLSPWVLYRRGLCMNVRTCCCTCNTTPNTRSTESWQRRESQNPAGERAVATRALCTELGCSWRLACHSPVSRMGPERMGSVILCPGVHEAQGATNSLCLTDGETEAQRVPIVVNGMLARSPCFRLAVLSPFSSTPQPTAY